MAGKNRNLAGDGAAIGRLREALSTYLIGR
jgi:hypothetical protein